MKFKLIYAKNLQENPELLDGNELKKFQKKIGKHNAHVNGHKYLGAK